MKFNETDKYILDLENSISNHKSEITDAINEYLNDWHDSKWHICPDRIDEESNVQPYVPCTCSKFSDIKNMVRDYGEYNNTIIRFLMDMVRTLAEETDAEYCSLAIREFEKIYFSGKKDYINEIGKKTIKDIKWYRLLKDWGKRNNPHRKEVNIEGHYLEDFVDLQAFFKELNVKKR